MTQRRQGSAQSTSKPICILVLGMHRSGTSAITRTLNLAGAAIPNDLLPASAGNPTGHWEPQAIVDFNSRLLQIAESSWDDCRPLDWEKIADRTPSLEAELRRIVESEYADAQLIVIKDPRVCRLVQFYRSALSGIYECRCVIAVRAPDAAAGSLGQRDRFTLPYAALLWLRHVLESEYQSRGLACAYVEFSALLKQPIETVARLIAELDLPLDLDEHTGKQITDFLDRDLVHHADETGAEPTSEARRLANTVWRILTTSDGEERETALDAVRVGLNEGMRLHAAPVAMELLERDRKANLIVQWMNARIADLESAVGAADEERQNLRAELSQRDQDQRELEAQNADLLQQCADLDARLAEAFESGKSAAVRAAEHARKAALEEMRQTLSWRVTAPLRQLSTMLRRIACRSGLNSLVW